MSPVSLKSGLEVGIEEKQTRCLFVSYMGTMPRSTRLRAIDLEHQRSFRAALPYNHGIAYQPVRSTQYTVRSRACGC